MVSAVFCKDKVICLQICYVFSFLLSSLSHVSFFLPLCWCEKLFLKEIFACIHMHAHLDSYHPIPLQQLFSESTWIAILRQQCMLLVCFTALSLFGRTDFMLDTVGLKKVSGLALSSCFSGEYKVPVDQVQTSGCLREREKKVS